MDPDEGPEAPSDLPRWVTVPLGLLLLPITLLCVLGSSFLVVSPNVEVTALYIALVSIVLAGSLWVLLLSLRLVFGKPRRRRGFLGPYELRLIAITFAAIPVVSICVGTFWEKPVLHSLMTVGYAGIVISFWQLAKERSQAGQGESDA